MLSHSVNSMEASMNTHLKGNSNLALASAINFGYHRLEFV